MQLHPSHLRSMTAAEWAALNPVLGHGEVVVEFGALNSVPKMKIGNGVTAYNDLPYAYNPENASVLVTADDGTPLKLTATLKTGEGETGYSLNLVPA